jgi:hypothetical protein
VLVLVLGKLIARFSGEALHLAFVSNKDQTVRQLFDQVAAYAASTSQEELSMQSAQLNRRARELAHEYADYFNLYHKSFGKGKDRYVVIRHEPSRLKVGRYEQDAWVECA